MAYYEGGHGVEKDLKQARLWADRSAAQGDPRGLMYSAQLETDPEKRFDAMYKSANQGYAPAQVGLAALVVHRIAPRKPSKSGLSEIYDVIFWLSKAAEQGEPNAQVMLAKGLVGGTPGSDTTDTTDTLEIAYEWVCRALDRHDNRFPLVDLWRNAGLALRGQIEAVLPGDAQLRALSSNKSWQPKPDLPYRHGD
jgi:TPR repeat protein